MKDKRIAPLSVRVTEEERALIERRAEAVGLSVSGYMKWCSLERFKGSPPPKTRLKHPTKDQKALAQLLALFGQSRLANNVNQLAHACNTGSLPVNMETEKAIQSASQAVTDIRDMLVRALGLRA